MCGAKSMSDSGQQHRRPKKNAFSSPSVAVKQRGFARLPLTSSRGSDGSVYSRRSVSMIQSVEDAEIFGQLSGSTSVSLSKRKKVSKPSDSATTPTGSVVQVGDYEFNPQVLEKAVSGAMDELVGSALTLMRSFVPSLSMCLRIRSSPG